jgi:ketosteroid isomerase-like protein
VSKHNSGLRSSSREKRAAILTDMVSANVDLVRSIYAAWEHGDFSSADWAHPEIEFVQPDGPDPGSYAGRAAMAKAVRDRLGAFEGYRMEGQEYRELDDERVLVLTRFSGRGKTSGLDLGEMRSEGAGLFQFHDGKVTRYVYWIDINHALDDLGLAPEGGRP